MESCETLEKRRRLEISEHFARTTNWVRFVPLFVVFYPTKIPFAHYLRGRHVANSLRFHYGKWRTLRMTACSLEKQHGQY